MDTMNYYPYLGLRLLEDLAKGESVTKHFFRLRRLKHAEPEIINNHKFNALKRLLNHAYQNVPLYKKMFADQDCHPEDIKSFEDFAKLPSLSREDVQGHTQDLISEAADKKSLQHRNSSGTTGTRLNFYHDKLSMSAGRAAVLIGWEMAGKSLGDPLTTLWGNRIVVEEQWSTFGSRLKAKLYKNTRIPSYLIIDETQLRETLNLILKQKGGFLQGYTSSLYALALYTQRHGIEVEHQFDGILTTAETLFPHQRQAIEEVFGPVYDGYGSHEILGIAYQCQERHGYHVVDPNVIFETEEFTGDLKEIVITDLWNYAFPFIRYRIGDLVSGEMGPCPCGCTWRRVERIEGRGTDALFTPQGGIFPITAIGFRVMRPYCPPIQQYQLAKVADNKLVLRLQIKENEQLDLNMIKSLMEPNFMGMWQLDVIRVDTFKVGPSGKHKVIVDETT
jgi:phenylacetate-CoA ligase